MSRKKKLKSIVLFVDTLVGPGGAERLLLEEYTFFKKMGIKTTILTFQLKRKALFDYKVCDLEVLKKSNYLSEVLSLRKRLKEIKPDLIVAVHDLHVYPATIFTGIPYILHIHGSMFWINDWKKYALIHKRVFKTIRESVIGHKQFVPEKPRFSALERIRIEVSALLDYLVVKKAKKVLVLSPQMRWEVEKLYGKDSAVLRGGVKPDLLNYKPKQNMKKKLGLEGKRIILSVGRLDPRKRTDILIKAFAGVRAKFDDVVLIIVGSGSDKGRLTALVKGLGLGDKIIFTGHVKDDELWDYYAACDVFVTPAWAEFDIAPYEALALQKKVVWSSEMADDLLKDERVIAAEPTSEEFAEDIQKALMVKIRGKLDLQDYTWESYCKKILNICERVVLETKHNNPNRL
jgi:glycosyltransferase involved in cell wall biosynthesis